MLTLYQSLTFFGLILETVAVFLSFSKLFGLWEYPTEAQKRKRNISLLGLFVAGMVFQIIAVFITV